MQNSDRSQAVAIAATALMLAAYTVLMLAAYAAPAFAQTVDLSAVDGAGEGFLTWVRGSFATILFSLALIFAGLQFIFGNGRWMLVGLIAAGGVLIFAGDSITDDFVSIFS